jgi:GH35 family endo-1,4-beta-xylanase
MFCLVTAASFPPVTKYPTLREAAAGHLFVGAAVNYGYLTGNTSPPLAPADVQNYSALVASEFSIITAENALKMKQTEGTAKGKFNFTTGDAVVNFARYIVPHKIELKVCFVVTEHTTSAYVAII